ncbi:hypothetical protein GGE50_001981 [Rhizobium leguminosarum]|nr:hypothetical protein [Rhizobium leguminosarum]MBB4327855.1 hypothetical protein [Rhizobium leguminosarum]MBB4341994.1 hypothetical protein [Rhizobium leguminosarum]MBB4353520.1 hypothetical protein [Rhizobium leguminosarum]MBB4384810.1 hypothetical protein [Rhizobium leguminosarum]
MTLLVEKVKAADARKPSAGGGWLSESSGAAV